MRADRLLSWVLLFGLLAAPMAGAIELEHADVQKRSKSFHLEARSIVAAPPEFVYDVLLDFNNFHRLSTGMVETRYLPPDEEGVPLGYTLVAACIWFFCTEFEKVERMWAMPKSGLVTLAIPERSDFRFYSTRWHVEAVGGRTRLSFEGTMEPDFWVPPLIGTWAVQRKLRFTALEMGAMVEYLYTSRARLAELPATGSRH